MKSLLLPLLLALVTACAAGPGATADAQVGAAPPAPAAAPSAQIAPAPAPPTDEPVRAPRPVEAPPTNRPAPPMSQPLPAEPVRERAPVKTGEVDLSCRTAADCAVKNVGSCCGAQPACVNVNSPTNPDAVRAACAKDGRVGVCGFRPISGCECVKGQCQPDGHRVLTD